MTEETNKLLKNEVITESDFAKFCYLQAALNTSMRFGMFTGALPAIGGAIVGAVLGVGLSVSACFHDLCMGVPLMALLGHVVFGGIGWLPGAMFGLLASPIQGAINNKTRKPNLMIGEIKKKVNAFYETFIQDDKFVTGKEKEFDTFVENIAKAYKNQRKLYSSSCGSTQLLIVLNDRNRDRVEKAKAIKEYMTTSTLYRDTEKNKRYGEGCLTNFFSGKNWLYNNGKRFFNIISEQLDTLNSYTTTLGISKQ